MRALNLATIFIGVFAIGSAYPIDTASEYTQPAPLSRRHENTKKDFHSFGAGEVTDGHVVKRHDIDIEARQTCNQKWTEKCDADTKKREEIVEKREPCRGKWNAKCDMDTKKRDELAESLPHPDVSLGNCNDKFHPGCFVAKMKKRWAGLWEGRGEKEPQGCSTKWEPHCRKTKRDLEEKSAPVEKKEVLEVKNRKRCNGIFLPRCKVSGPKPTEAVNPEEQAVSRRDVDVEARQNCNGRFNDKCGFDNKRDIKPVKPRGCNWLWRPQCGGSE